MRMKYHKQYIVSILHALSRLLLVFVGDYAQLESVQTASQGEGGTFRNA